jgi:hypothetical protein
MFHTPPSTAASLSVSSSLLESRFCSLLTPSGADLEASPCLSRVALLITPTHDHYYALVPRWEGSPIISSHTNHASSTLVRPLYHISHQFHKNPLSNRFHEARWVPNSLQSTVRSRRPV